MARRTRAHTAADEATAAMVIRKMQDPQGLATDLEKVASAITVLANSRLKWDTVVLLVAASSGAGKRTVDTILRSAMNLNTDYLKDEEDE